MGKFKKKPSNRNLWMPFFLCLLYFKINLISSIQFNGWNYFIIREREMKKTRQSIWAKKVFFSIFLVLVFFWKKREFNLNSCGQQQLKNHQIYYCKRRKCLKTKRKKIQNFSLEIKKVFFSLLHFCGMYRESNRENHHPSS